MSFLFIVFSLIPFFFFGFWEEKLTPVANGLQEKGMKMAQKIWVRPLSATMKEWDMQR